MVFAKSVALATAVIGDVRPDQLDDPTPCADFDVRTMLSHLVMVLRRTAALGRGDDPLAIGLVEGVADDGWQAAWRDAAHDLQDAWSDDSVLTRIMVLPWAELPGGEILLAYASEVTVHTWDLARATGQEPAFDDAVVGLAMAAMEQMLPVEGRDDEWVPFGAVVEVPAGAAPIERLVAYTGRRP